MELAGLDQEAHGNSCFGARLIPEIFVLCPWYKAEHLWPWYRAPHSPIFLFMDQIFGLLTPCSWLTLCDPIGQNTITGRLSLLQGSSWPRNQTGVSCIAGRLFTNSALREALMTDYLSLS